MKKVEYNIVCAPLEPAEQLDVLAKYGEDGWCLSQVMTLPDTNHCRLYLYRIIDQNVPKTAYNLDKVEPADLCVIEVLLDATKEYHVGAKSGWWPTRMLCLDPDKAIPVFKAHHDSETGKKFRLALYRRKDVINGDPNG